MKLFVSAAALAVAFAAPVMAATETTVSTEPTVVMMSAEDCAAALAKCAGADKATCEKDLEAKGCKAPTEAAK